METKYILDTYTPVLKAKRGELGAVFELKEHTKKCIFPMFEIMPIPWNYPQDKPAKSIDEHLDGTIEQIGTQWGDLPYLIDLPYVSDEDLLEDNNHPLEFLADQAIAHTPEMIPVTGLYRSDLYNSALKNVLSKLGTGLALRLRTEDFEDDDVEEAIMDTLKFFRAREDSVDLVVDFGSLPQNGYTPYIASLKLFLRMIPNIKSWRRLIFIASSFPDSLQDTPSGTDNKYTRGEWVVWKSIAKTGKVERLPRFGDYGVVHPQPFEMDPRLMQLGTKIKYTIDKEWFIVKGRGVKKHGYEQFRKLANKIVNSEHYCGEDFSYGDKYIKDCADGSVGTGNQTTWVKVAVNHHLEFVVNQLAILSDF